MPAEVALPQRANAASARLRQQPPRTMAALDTSGVSALSNKATTLYNKGRFMISAQKFGAAVEAARALPGVDGADDLMLAYVRVMQADALLQHANGVPAEALPLEREAYTVLLPAVLGPLERRRRAGTLLFGMCRPHEVAWFAEHVRNNARFYGDLDCGSDIQGQSVGYTAFLFGARIALERLTPTTPGACALLLGIAEAAAYRAFVMAALDLIALPRPREETQMGCEGTLVEMVQNRLRRLYERRSDARVFSFYSELAEAWARVIRSGALERRSIAQSVEQTETDTLARKARAQQDAAKLGLRCCALSGCGMREAHAAHFKSCAACGMVVYCGKEHQKADWPSHKARCMAARKAAAAAADGAGPSDS